jgi:hypothetical protein
MNHTNKKIRVENVQTGTISGIEDCGTVVIVRLRTEKGWSTPVFFDHRQFGHMLGAEGCSATDLVGREAIYDGTIFLFVE